MSVIIHVENISKCYQIGTRQQGYRTFGETLTQAVASPFRRLQRLKSGGLSENSEEFWALKDVNFSVAPGDVLGIVGRNGAGKSTLLKVLSRITEPTSGRIKLWGRVASLLEVGTGFHPELTGRENIFLNGAILGMTRHDIQRNFDDIVEFSGVGKFLETPVKRYSSGMYVRLAFAVAAHLDPEILIVDEVLAVGDVTFQKKCLAKMEDVAQNGRTVLFVSHNLSAVSTLCTSALWIKDGQSMAQGKVSDILSLYRQEVSGAAGSAKSSNAQLRILSLEVVRPGENSTTTGDIFKPFEPVVIRVQFENSIDLNATRINLNVQDSQSRNCIHLRTDFDDLHPVFKPGRHEIEIEIDALNLESQIYFLWVRIACMEPRLVTDSEAVPLEVNTGWDRHENVQPLVAVKRRWNWRTL